MPGCLYHPLSFCFEIRSLRKAGSHLFGERADQRLPEISPNSLLPNIGVAGTGLPPHLLVNV